MDQTSLVTRGATIADEFSGAALGDRRRTARLCAIASSWSAQPNKCVPGAAPSPAAEQGTYRFLSNREITYDSIVEAHVSETCGRVTRGATVVVAHDTSEFEFKGEVRRKGLGRLRSGEQGFLAHVALAIEAERRRPLGVVGFSPWTRTGKSRRRKANGKKASGADYAKYDNKESARWGKMVNEVRDQLGDNVSPINVMDREADAFPLLCQLVEFKHRFVVRLSKDRVVELQDIEGRLRETLDKLEGAFTLDVPISRRAKSTIPAITKTFPAREERLAKLGFSATPLRIKKPRYVTNSPTWLDVKIVWVREVAAPSEVQPIEWILATTEPIATPADVLRIVEFYRMRWLIEEFFKALKTGCAVEKRQHESLQALLNVVAICLPIAWQMLLLRNLARTETQAPATEVLTSTQIEVMRACSPFKLADSPTVSEALRAIASIGGYHRKRGEPGWIILGRGMERLLLLETGWRARSDVMDH